ncbi:hypothetical protein BRADI_5g08864v3 [Brachypodium distachyon]|uniref:Reverse transcriptase zinc-binding domain-containing protein n=1 Tax=Brachypodium distachyon TaxID=15368 RepID=A0A2K2CG34_BRADI|nr:hypothetical protein BRADI_5g08864v3 [Brachypodium distachyon]
MQKFNQALLARQAWRLLAKPNSLCARLIKSKYFPHGNLLDTAFIRSSSSVWQGITHVLDLLKKGYVWRIGNGRSVDIWRDNWLPRGNFRVSGRASQTRLRRVSDLIDPANHRWNEDLIRHVFYPHDADAILLLKLPETPQDNVLAWVPDKTGSFTVRSAYQLAMDCVTEEREGCSSASPSGERKLWSTIWKARVPPKVRVFGWRLATNALAVQEERSKRIKKSLPTCGICGKGNKNAFHAVMECPKAIGLRQRMRQVWQLPPEEKLRYTGKDWVLVLLDFVNELTRQRLLFLWWRAWDLRNDSIFGSGRAPVEESAVFISCYSQAMENIKGDDDVLLQCLDIPVDSKELAMSVHRHSTPALDTRPSPVDRWKPPEQGCLKLNFDAGFLPASGESYWGAALRCSNGRTSSSLPRIVASLPFLKKKNKNNSHLVLAFLVPSAVPQGPPLLLPRAGSLHMHISFPISACPPSAADFAPGSAHLAGSLGPSRIVDADLGSCPLWAYPSPACRHSRIYQSTLLAGPILYKMSTSTRVYDTHTLYQSIHIERPSSFNRDGLQADGVLLVNL